MGTSGFFAYRHKSTFTPNQDISPTKLSSLLEKYYRQYLYSDAYPLKPGMGQHLVDTIPRNPTAFKAWIAERIRMLKTVQRFDASDPSGGPERRPDSVKPDDAGYTVTYTNQWTFIGERWSYVIDLDNLALTINGVHHWRLDHLPLDLGDYYGDFSLEHDIPAEHLCDNVDLWPPPLFDTEERLAKYEALRPIIVPAAEWCSSLEPTIRGSAVLDRDHSSLAPHGVS
ncbi:unnamed protein product [Rhizoctonia solani]|uniref:Uncharacterized protein n=1 Tax=Rhizoctonia solani TaxID=456999 RepID=A0A8H2Y0A6_9AGAM|nr:unnamed protein product [Rhizoctonia solani]